MMHRSTTILTAVSLLALQAAPALAERPVFREHIKHEDDWHLVGDLTDGCGFDVLHRERVNVVIRGFEDRIELNVSGRTEFTTPEGEETLINRFSQHSTFVEEISTDDDVEVVTVERTFRGLPAMWFRPGEGVLWRDAGLAHFTTTVTIDTSGPEPEPIDSSLDVHEVHGPHPELEMSDEEFLARVCGALT